MQYLKWGTQLDGFNSRLDLQEDRIAELEVNRKISKLMTRKKKGRIGEQCRAQEPYKT